MDNVKTGALIASIRKEKGLTQQTLADQIGVTSAAISKWENGKGFPDISLLNPLADALGISITELIMGERTQETIAEDTVIHDLVDISMKEQHRKTRFYNWAIAITVAFMYLVVSILTQKWEITWIIWLAYCIYRVLTEYIFKSKQNV